MKTSTFLRHIREGAKNFTRNGWMTFAAIGSVVVTLLILGVFLVVAMNLQAVTKDVEAQVKLSVSVQQGVSRNDISQLENKLHNLQGVKSVKFISKEDGLQALKERLRDNADLLKGLEMENPLPDMFEVTAQDPRETLQLADKVRTFPFVEKVNDGKDTVEKLYAVVDVVRWIGGGLVVGLLFTAVFLISNTIKITIFARRREIEIMKLVGATNWFIRWPFFVEGMLMGVLGATIPIVLIAIGYSYAADALKNTFVSVLPLQSLIFVIGGVLLVVGAVIGTFGSAFSVRKFLKV